MVEFLATFVPAFVAGLAVNFQSAVFGMVGALLLGLPLALLRNAAGLAGRSASVLVGLFRATPTFVVMFFLVNVLPSSFSLGAFKFAMSPWLAVVLALVIFGSAYIADNAMAPLRELATGSHRLALLFIMGLVRVFFVMVLSSGFGAAVGVIEATTITVRAVESLPSVADRLILIGVVIAMFTIVFQIIYQLIDFARRKFAARIEVV